MIIGLRLVSAAVLGSGILAGASCSAEAPPPAPPVPAIESPKGLLGIDPCTLLSGSARTELGLGPGVPGQDELGGNCRWSGQTPLAVQLTTYTSGAGLSDLTGTADPAAARVRLSGYPALETFTAGGRFCRYDVGVAPGQAIVATMNGGAPDSCTALQKLLTDVLLGLPGSG